MILHWYFAKRFLLVFCAVLALFFAIFGLLDLIEKVGDFSDRSVGLFSILGLTLLVLPGVLYQILPLIMILTSIFLFLALARSSELVIARAAGRSALRALLGPALATLAIGLLGVSMINPIVAATTREHDSRRAELMGETRKISSVGSDGLWLREGSDRSQTVIHAAAANPDGTVLSDVTFLTYSADAKPMRRIEAIVAQLTPQGWRLTGVKSWPLDGFENPEALAATHQVLTLPSNLTLDQIRDSFGAPQAVAIWDLPGFIARLESAGFSAKRHRIWMQSELALPLFLLAMMLVGAGFTMRHQRGGQTGMMTLLAILSGFGLYFVRNFAQVLGENGQIPVALATWAPPAAALMLAIGLLLHKEDG